MLDTKLYVPRPRNGAIDRARLVERLQGGIESTLTLVSAPAGFGKTSLLAGWLAGIPTAVRARAWVSLDAGDRNPATFWSYVIASLQTAVPGFGTTARAWLQDGQPPPIRSILATLLNELASAAPPLILVLDDYHLADTPEVQDGVELLLERLPPQVHVVIATRADPGFPLARLRARGELNEIRASDLRFTHDEAVAYLNGTMGLDLAALDVAVLEDRTEGWIAALQLAALSMQGGRDASGFVSSFAGDDRYVVDYLVEEVLRRQSASIRRFLLETSILTRLTGSSADAVTGRPGGAAMIERLDRMNLFVVPLDDRRQQYRYHHLFADVLHTRLLEELPELVPTLHRRAGAWLEAHDEVGEAIRHRLLAGDVERAADLMEQVMPSLRSRRQDGPMLGWLQALPVDTIAARPVLSVHYAGVLIDRGRIDGADQHLRDAERWLDGPSDPAADPGPPPIVVDAAEFRRLPGSIAVYRAAIALLRGDAAATVAHAADALRLLEPDDHLGRGSAAGLLALSHWTAGDLEPAFAGWMDAMENLEAAGHVTDAVGCCIALADIRTEQGRIRDSMAVLERGLRLATSGGTPLRGTADMHVGMSERAYQSGDLDAAARHLVTSRDLGEHLGLRQNPYRWRVAMARIRVAESDPAGALALLDDAERVYVSDFYPPVRPIPALRARVLIHEGRLLEARAWAREAGLSADDDVTYLRAFDLLTLARLMVAESARHQHDHVDDALALLDRLLESALDGGRQGQVIEILVVRALAHGLGGDHAAALVPLDRALVLAEPEGAVRTFVDAGGPIADLLAMVRGPQASYARVVRSAFDRGSGSQGPSVTSRSHAASPVESLSARELEVLRLLASDLDGPDIASHLIISVSTFRSHTKAIYGKLGVSSRRAAVRRGEELGLLA